MKSIRSISALTVFFLLLLASPAEAALSSRDVAPTVQRAGHADPTAYREAKGKKLGFFKRMKLVWEVKKAGMRPTSEGEKASTLAKTALYLFLGGVGLSLAVSFAATSTSIISAIASLAILASIVLSFIVLFGDENRKSKAIAKALLIVNGVMILITLVVFVAIIAAFAAW